MPELRETSNAADSLLTLGCHRNVAAELQYEADDRNVATGRVRLLALTPRHVLTDAPVYFDGDDMIPCGAAITVYVVLNGQRFEFASVIEEDSCQVRLNARQTVPGLALSRPAVLRESQRRGHFRVSLVGYDPINVDLGRAVPAVPDACSLAEGLARGWLSDLSLGGASVIVDRRAIGTVSSGDHYYVSFCLPDVPGCFNLLGSVRHTRMVSNSESQRIGFSFLPWNVRSLESDQKRLARFIAEHERRLLRRRRK